MQRRMVLDRMGGEHAKSQERMRSGEVPAFRRSSSGTRSIVRRRWHRLPGNVSRRALHPTQHAIVGSTGNTRPARATAVHSQTATEPDSRQPPGDAHGSFGTEARRRMLTMSRRSRYSTRTRPPLSGGSPEPMY